ncbi:hypothetical protein JW905_17705 [bacterium]|nr:hypothetical protein [candidate division CSSED10-310 bacterium]
MKNFYILTAVLVTALIMFAPAIHAAGPEDHAGEPHDHHEEIAAFDEAVQNPDRPAQYHLGQAIDETALVAIETLLAEPESYVDKTVTVKGDVIQGCHHAGGWIRVGDARYNIDAYCDKTWHYPTDHKGYTAIVTGTVRSHLLLKEKLAGYIEHQNKLHEGNMKLEDYPDGLNIYYIQSIGALLTMMDAQVENVKQVEQVENADCQEHKTEPVTSLPGERAH